VLTPARTLSRLAMIVAPCCLLLSGCSESAPIGVLLSTDGSVSVLARPCPGNGIGKVVVLEHGEAIYTAVLDQGIGADNLPLIPLVQGYSVTGRFPAARDAVGRTFIARLTSNDRVYLGAVEIKYEALRPGLVLYGHAKYESADKFRQRKGVDCP
jgi:hypothetical protein